MSSESGSAMDVQLDSEVPKSPVYGNGAKPPSIRSKHAHHPADPTPMRRPIDKFRSTVNKVIAMKRSTATFAAVGAGAEPGVDPRRASMEMQYRAIHRDCTIEVIDYSAVSCKFAEMRNAEFVQWCGSPKSERQSWVKIRWINITGISWDVVKALSFKHDSAWAELHPLALEDVLHSRPENLSKAEYFLHHLFLRILIHDVEDESSRPTFPVDEFAQDPSVPHNDIATKERQIEQAKIDALKQGTLRVSVTPMFIFLLRDGTVISITQQAPPELTLPITDRLRRADTILRSSADPSLLVQSLISLIVDKAVQVIEAYHGQISHLERQILVKPKPSTVRKLHIVSGDLVLHKRTLNPIKTLVYGLRRYDVDRCAALIDESDPATKGQPIVGFMSHKSKIYLVLYRRVLTMITIICLPLTFVSGYFGMNFEGESGQGVAWTTEWTDVLFWIISLPLVLVISPLFIIPDIKKMIHYIKTRKLLRTTANRFK
ncbi:hypothetical protein GGX14DRAFT_656755 [Mycena pura]|uniref:Uncharacterized protein n=1 Tax=Mycena pura TaxID=153505 RepID=A0AAD6V3B6_9AGAR|nr:hypothetical protein GGX14DRAFT_656755 [Mycena pura]